MTNNCSIEQFNHNRKVYDFIRWNVLAFSISFVMIVISIATMFIYGFNLGLDFTGGTVAEIHLEQPVNLIVIKNALKKSGFQAPIIQFFGNSHDVIVRMTPHNGNTGHTLANEVIMIIHRSLDNHALLKRVEFIGPSVGSDLLQKGSSALLLALICILAYVAFRFEWRLALGTVMALIHDIIITLGILSMLYIEIDLTILASLMSVIGYSLNDSIVVSDRVRENFYKIENITTYDVMNISLTQTLSRTLLTSGTTLLVVLMLYIFGGPMLHGFSLTMLIGVSVGTISSIYVASALAFKLGVKREHMLIPKAEKEGDDKNFTLP